MIEIIRHDGGFSVCGHAGYAEDGYDIVCASVSTLVYSLIASIEELTDDVIQYETEKGNATIDHGQLSERGQLLVDAFFVSAELISTAYPQYVQIANK